MLSYITWTFKPQLFMLGNWEVRWYGVLYAFAFYFGLVLVTKMFKKEKVKDSWVDILFLYVIAAVIIGARLGHVFFYAWDYYSQHPWEILKIWEGGLASHGGAIGILIAIWIYSKYVTKRSMLWTMDRLVIPVAFAGLLIRTGNLCNHEIYGYPTTLPWGFRFITNLRQWQHGADPIFTDPCHPTQIYEGLCYLACFIFLWWLYNKGKTAKNREGLIFGIFLVWIFTARILIEFIKLDQEAFEASMKLNMGQLLSIPFVIAGVILIILALKKKPVYYYVETIQQDNEKKPAKNEFSSNVKTKTTDKK
jgi:phosphatidylglycerol---prolipoprotein diacylglyceryl transferase